MLRPSFTNFTITIFAFLIPTYCPSCNYNHEPGNLVHTFFNNRHALESLCRTHQARDGDFSGCAGGGTSSGEASVVSTADFVVIGGPALTASGSDSAVACTVTFYCACWSNGT